MKIRIHTERPVALDSPDHQQPLGARNDNSTWPPFNAKLLERWPQVRLLDIGCAGGGLVASLLDQDCLAVGIEGSDFPRRSSLGEWWKYPDHLFTADAGYPFQLYHIEAPMIFDVVTAWEVMEHFPEDRLADVMANINRHLAPDGVFMASISPRHFPPWHQTVKGRGWWMQWLRNQGWELDANLTDYIEPDWVRGPRTDPGSLVGVWRPWLRPSGAENGDE